MIEPYLELLARELDFDRSLSRGVRQEVEDHLWQAVAADTAENRLEAQQRAVASFGDARTLAAQFAVISLARRSRRTGIAAVLVIGAVLMAMKVRVAWYAALQWAISDDMRAVSGWVVRVDRYAFWLALIMGLGGFAYIRSRHIPLMLHRTYLKQLRRFFLLSGLAAAALVISVLSDAVLTALQLRGTEWSASCLVPILSMAIEIACVGVLLAHIRSVALRATGTAALLNS
jgi:hypothetical protein